MGINSPKSDLLINSNTTPNLAASNASFTLRIVGAAAVAHLLNDLIQAMLPAIFPMLKLQFSLTFTEIGMIALIYQATASLLQPWIGLYTDKHPMPYLLPLGMIVTLIGILLLSTLDNYPMLLVAAAVIGVGSATFHPEASRVARMASGGRFGTAQSTFQVGGNAGSAIGPLITAAIVIPFGQHAIAWFMIPAIIAIQILFRLSKWSSTHGQVQLNRLNNIQKLGLNKTNIIKAIFVICILMFAKFVYIASFTNYFTFYLIERFALSVQESQVFLFIFLSSIALGTFAGGPLGDRIGRKAVIWVSFLGVAPFSLALPHVDLLWTCILSSLIGLIMSSAFAALVVYAQEAVPGRIGLISGLMFGLMFGIGGIGAAAMGKLADHYSIIYVYKFTAYLPLLGLVTVFLPNTRKLVGKKKEIFNYQKKMKQ